MFLRIIGLIVKLENDIFTRVILYYMYKIVWDTETGGVKFLNRKTENCLSVSPRPVFFEVLDLLGLNRLPGGK